MEWISTEERLPKKGVSVLCYSPQEPNALDKYAVDHIVINGLGDISFDWFGNMCTHWMPLPEPPKTVQP